MSRRSSFSMSDKDQYALRLFSAIGFIGTLGLLFSAKWGVGIWIDSVIYIRAARNLLNGFGLSILSGSGELMPLVHFPPLFPALLALIGLFGIDPLNGAGWLNACLFGANILLVGFVINRYTRSISVSIFGSVLMLASIDMLYIHSMAWTEPSFIFFALAGLCLLAAHIDNPKSSLLILSSSAIALAFLTRYVGVTVVATGIAGILLWDRRAYSRRIVDSVIFAVISVLPIGLWMIRNLHLTGSITDREILFHPITLGHFAYAMKTMSKWFLPGTVPLLIRESCLMVAGIGLLGLSILLFKRERVTSGSAKQYLEKLPHLLVAFIGIYWVFLSISISFFDAATPLDLRILSPIFVSGLVLILCLAHGLFVSVKDAPVVKVISAVLVILFAGCCLLRGASWGMNTRDRGLGYTAKNWKGSEVIQEVRNLASGSLIYSNGPHAVYILTGRNARRIPRKIYHVMCRPNDRYLAEMGEMEEELRNKGGVLVYFDRIGRKRFWPTRKELHELLPLYSLVTTSDGVIYKVK